MENGHSVTAMATLAHRDYELEQLWAQFGDIPMDDGTERLEEPFLHFPAGTEREDVWHWFDSRHSKGIAYLLYGDGIDRTPETAKLLYMKQLCFECESKDCTYNHGGECRFCMVNERKPKITEENGCEEGIIEVP